MKIVIFIFMHFLLYVKTRGSYGKNPTFVEDANGEYTLKSIKELITNNSLSFNATFNKLNTGIKKLQSSSEVLSAIKGIKDDIDKLVLQNSNLVKYTENFKEYMEKLNLTLKTMELNILKKIEDIPNVINGKSKNISSLLTQSALLTIAVDCYDLYSLGFNATGAYWLQVFGRTVLCDMETDGGGWTLMQRRTKMKEQVDFSQKWLNYKIGFGNIDGEFWIGNGFLHTITNRKQYEMLIEMQDFEKGYFYARYSSFRIGNESSSYSLDVGNYTGNSTDAFSYHHGRQFTTIDNDKDSYSTGNCAEYFSGGWWYDKCYDAHLNGLYPETADRSNASFITWWSKDETNARVPLVLTEVTMKIRPYIEK